MDTCYCCNKEHDGTHGVCCSQECVDEMAQVQEELAEYIERVTKEEQDETI